MTFKFKHVLQPLFLIAAFFAIAQLGSVVSAMAVYNYTSVAINADFDCGWFCNNKWHPINPGDSKNRPNEAGTLEAWKGSDGRYADNHGCDVDVDEHGWVVFTPGNGTIVNVNSYHQDGSAHENCSFDPATADWPG